jgi:hypothetical protein
MTGRLQVIFLVALQDETRAGKASLNERFGETVEH